MTHMLEIVNTSNWLADQYVLRYKDARNGVEMEVKLNPGEHVYVSPSSIDQALGLQLTAIKNEEIEDSYRHHTLLVGSGEIGAAFFVPVSGGDPDLSEGLHGP